MEKHQIQDDEVAYDMDTDLVTLYLFVRIKKLKPEWFEEALSSSSSNKPARQYPLRGAFSIICIRNQFAFWEDDIPGFIAFVRSTRIYQ